MYNIHINIYKNLSMYPCIYFLRNTYNLKLCNLPKEMMNTDSDGNSIM